MQPNKNLATSTILFPVFLPAVIIAVLLITDTLSKPDLNAEIFAATLAYITRAFAGSKTYIYGCDQQNIINDILDQFEKYLHFLNVSPGILPWKMEEHGEAAQEHVAKPKSD